METNWKQCESPGCKLRVLKQRGTLCYLCGVTLVSHWCHIFFCNLVCFLSTFVAWLQSEMLTVELPVFPCCPKTRSSCTGKTRLGKHNADLKKHATAAKQVGPLDLH